MKSNKLQLITFLLFVLGLTRLQAQTMYVKEKSGMHKDYTLTSIRKLTFSGGNFNIHQNGNSSSYHSLIGIRYLNFTDLSSSINEYEAALFNIKIHTYPNPVSNVLSIDLEEVEYFGMIKIFSLDGKLVKEQEVNGSSKIAIDLGQLSNGIYICRFSSFSDIRTIKIFKQ